VDEPDGRLLVADGAAQRLLRVEPARGRIDAVTDRSLGRPELAREADGTIYAIANRRVHRIDPATGRGTPVSDTVFDGPTSIAVGPSGELYVAEYASRIRRVDPATGDRPGGHRRRRRPRGRGHDRPPRPADGPGDRGDALAGRCHPGVHDLAAGRVRG